MTLATFIERRRINPENWRYTDIEKILAGPEATPALERRRRPLEGEAALSQLWFENGFWVPEKSRFGDLPPDILKGDHESGYRMELAGQTCMVTQPIELYFTGSAAEAATRLRIELGASGRLTLIERHEGQLSQKHFMETEISLGPQAKLVHGKLIEGEAEAAHLASTTIAIAEGAFYDNFALLRGGRLIRNEIDASLNGKLAQCVLNGAMLLGGREHADTTTRIRHNAPYGSSRQVYKTVLTDSSRGVFQGKIIVAEGAQKTDGYQLSRALLLSDQAEMDAKPELEIYADDVKCSHGSTIGDLDNEAMFYLRTRGLNENAARAMLVRAFVGELLDDLSVPEWREMCRQSVEEWLNAKV